MHTRLGSTLSWLEKREKQVLWGAIAAFFVVVSCLCFAKYARLGYDAIDLAYFNQVFWNTVRGRFFQQSIHPHLSLGDHAELLIPLLAPVYALWQDPRMLLMMQAAVLALTAWPVWLLGKNRFPSPMNAVERFAPLLLALAWLTGPLLQNIAFFEFHILPFALFPLLFALLAYRRGNRRTFLLWTVLALLAREDVALVIMVLPILAIMERRTLWWRIVPLAIGATWFAGAMALIKWFAPAGGYKFAIYYAWLGDSIPAMLTNAATHPLMVIQHVMTLSNAEMFLGLLMPFALLPLLGPRSLVLALGPAAQITLGAASGGAIVIETHYSTLFLPALILAAMDGWAAASKMIARSVKLFSPTEARLGVPLLLVICAAYSAIAFGPLPRGMQNAAFPGDGIARAAAADAIIADIPPDAAVASSYALLPRLSSRERLYSTHYLFLGVTQFAEKEYQVPANLRYTAFELGDLIGYRASFPTTSWAAPYYADGLARLATAVGIPVARSGQTLLFDRQPGAAAITEPAPVALAAPISMRGLILTGADVRQRGDEILLATEWVVPAPHSDDVVLSLILKDPDGRVVREQKSAFETLPFAFLNDDGKRRIVVALRTDGLREGDYVPELRLVRADASLSLDGDKSLLVGLEEKEFLGELSFPPLTITSQ